MNGPHASITLLTHTYTFQPRTQAHGTHTRTYTHTHVHTHARTHTHTHTTRPRVFLKIRKNTLAQNSPTMHTRGRMVLPPLRLQLANWSELKLAVTLHYMKHHHRIRIRIRIRIRMSFIGLSFYKQGMCHCKIGA